MGIAPLMMVHGYTASGQPEKGSHVDGSRKNRGLSPQGDWL